MVIEQETDYTLSVTAGRRPGQARIILEVAHECPSGIALSQPSPACGGALQVIELEGAGLGTLSVADSHRLLRHCRHLLAPGGQLSLPVGNLPTEFPRTGLGEAAWLTGFESWIDFVAGCAQLTKPRREIRADSLVSILIPAYKSEYYAEALASAQAQTWPRCEIVVCDDGPGDRIEEISSQSSGPHPVRYSRNPKNLGGWANCVRCFGQARGRYIKFLNDDDLLHPDCVARMATILDERPAVTLVTGYRALIDAAGQALPDEVWNAPLTSVDAGIPGETLIGHALTQGINQIGEPTTAMFRRNDLLDNLPHLMSYAGQAIPRNGDMTMWTSLLSRGDAVYLTEALSSFRQHGSQVQNDPSYQSEGLAAWVTLKEAAARTGLPQDVGNLGAGLFSLLENREVTAGEKLFGEGDAEGALPIFVAALHRTPADARTRGNLACAAWALGQVQRALLEGVLAYCCDPHDETIALSLQDMTTAGV